MSAVELLLKRADECRAHAEASFYPRACSEYRAKEAAFREAASLVDTRPTPALAEAGAREVLVEHGWRVCDPRIVAAMLAFAARVQQPAIAERPRDTSAAVEGGSADLDTQGAQQPAAEVEAIVERLCTGRDGSQPGPMSAYRQGVRDCAAAIRNLGTPA